MRLPLAIALSLTLFGVQCRAEDGPPTTELRTDVTPQGAESTQSVVLPEPPESGPRVEARQRFASGIKLYEDGDFALALIEFERAYSLVPDYRVLFNIGQVSLQLGRYARATRVLRQFLKEGTYRIAPERVTSVTNDLNMLATRTATIQATSNIVGTEILFDSDVVATTPMLEPVLVDAGEHRIIARKLGYTTQTKAIALAGRDTFSVDFQMATEPTAVTTEKTVFVERSRGSDPNVDRKVWLMLGWSGTVLLGASWATTGYLGYSAAQDRADASERKTTVAELDRLETRASRYYIAADALGAATLLATGGMLYYTLASSPLPPKRSGNGDQSASLKWVATPTQLALLGRF